MPVQEGRVIPHEVVAGLVAQGLPFRLFVSTLHSDSQHADARNQVKRYGQTGYVLMLDNDIVLPPNSLSKLITFLDTHPSYAAIALCKNKNINFPTDDAFLHAVHVDMSCVLFRKEVLGCITFVDYRNATRLGRSRLVGQCECANACHDIRQMGYEIGFLPGVYVGHLHSAPVRP